MSTSGARGSNVNVSDIVATQSPEVETLQLRRGLASAVAVQSHGALYGRINLVTDWAFAEHDLARVHLVTLLDNPASERVAQRCGYHWEPFRRQGALDCH